jgi:sigma-B regulation protein RsbU (phosphoserine phosphatase)
MILRTSGLLLLIAVLSADSAGLACHAQQAQPTPAIRYHFGDDPDGRLGWINSSFDDSAWPVAKDGQWLRPPFYSDGFVWIRFRVPVRRDTAEPLALRIDSLMHVLIAYEVFINGTPVGGFGRVPPRPFVESFPHSAIFDLPHDLVSPGGVAVVTLRAWYPPAARRMRGLDSVAAAFDQSRTLHAEDDAVRERALLRNLPPMMLNGIIMLVGFTVLAVGYSAQSRDVRLCGAMLATLPMLTLFLQLIDARVLVLSEPVYTAFQAITQMPSMIVSVALIWGINDFRDVFFKRLMLAAMVVFNLGMLIAFMAAQASPLVTAAAVTFPLALNVFDLINICANLWAAFTVPRNRPIAVTMLLVPAASLLSGFRSSIQGGPNLFDVAFFLFGICLSVVLAYRAWKEWRTRDSLQAEFETAREMQQRLVPPAVDVPGFHIESAYQPAAHVGGDFFYIRPDEQASVLVVVGDVSGKGLKAAMTVSSIIGALRTMPVLAPARILAALNRGLVGQMGGGFVTCCVARIGADGAATIANAGHLSPYLAGTELLVAAGLPLGILAGAEYEESHFQLRPGQPLTFLSDGVIEARNQNGELFGFERTRAVSTASAEEVAHAAQAFGQEDDITVLTVIRTADLNPAMA